MSLRRSGLNPLAYMGVEPISISADLAFQRDPTSNDNQNVNLLTRWLNSVTKEVWILVSLESGVAQWMKIGSGSGPALTFPTDSGTATPDSNGNLQILGGENINTSAATNVVTVNLNDDIDVDSMSTSNLSTGLTIHDNTIQAIGSSPNININILPDGSSGFLKIGTIANDNMGISNTGSAGYQLSGYSGSASNTIFGVLSQYKISTADATATIIIALPIPQGATASITGIVQGRTRTTLANIFAADVFGTVYRQPSGDVTILGTPVVTSNTTTAGPSVDFYVDTGFQTFGIKVTGQAATNWDWGAIVTIATNA